MTNRSPHNRDRYARERARREQGEQRRAATPTPTGGPGHRAFRPGPDTVLFVDADFTENDDETWDVRIAPKSLGTVADGPLYEPGPESQAKLQPVNKTLPDLQTARSEALSLADAMADQIGMPVTTIRRYEGHSIAWIALAEREGIIVDPPSGEESS